MTAMTGTPKVIRRVFKQYGTIEGQVLVEVWVEEGVVRVAQRDNVSATWSPPLTEVLNEDEQS